MDNLSTKAKKWFDEDHKYFLHQSLSTPVLNVISSAHGIYIEDLNGKQARLHVSKDTKLVNGEKKPGDVIRAEVNKTGHILSIQ